MSALLNNSVFIGLILVLAGIICYAVNASAHDADLKTMGTTLMTTGLGFLAGAGHASMPQTNEGTPGTAVIKETSSVTTK